MAANEEMASGWSIFARVLAGLLARRGVGLTDLYHAGIYREEVRRLRRSLRRPGTFTVLNPSELQRISERYQLSPEEIWSLRAAVLATGVQRLLYGRIPADDAQLAAQEIFPLLLEAIQEARVSRVWRHDQDDWDELDELDDEDPSNRATDDDQDEVLGESDDLDLPQSLESEAGVIVDALEEGALALGFSVASHPIRERLRWARIAQHAFMEAQVALRKLPSAPDAEEIITAWTLEAQRGVGDCGARLAELSGAEIDNTEHS